MKKPINPTLANWQSQKKQPTQSEQTTTIKIDMPAPKALADTNQPPQTNATQADIKPTHTADTSTKEAAKGSGLGNLGKLDKLSQPSQASSPLLDTLLDANKTKPAFVKVDISIAGTPHRITCPADDVHTLKDNSDAINAALRDIRRHVHGKNPTNEELLVLHCLDLYDRLADLESQKTALLAETAQATTLLEKLIKDASAIL